MSNRPEPGQAFRHTDGGFYRVVEISDDSSVEFVVYRHLWPFDADGDPAQRPLSEWASRFTAVSEAELAGAMEEDEADAQLRVAHAKALRKAAARR